MAGPAGAPACCVGGPARAATSGKALRIGRGFDPAQDPWRAGTNNGLTLSTQEKAMAVLAPDSHIHDRLAKAPAPALPAFDRLDATHRAALEMIDEFQRLLQRLHSEGADDEARAGARRIVAFFEGPAKTHHAEEEQRVFPVLLAQGDAELVHHVRRLQQDHGWIEEGWRELGPQVRAIADGISGWDLDMLRQAVPIYRSLYEDHIGLEESLIYPEARKRLQPG
jgi:hemerythrin-like domain-containing protein